MKALLLHALLGVAFGSMDCPVYVCGDLADGVCSTISEDGNVITINENGCPKDYHCFATAPGPERFDCYYINPEGSEENQDEYYDSDLTGEDWKNSYNCLQRDPGKDLKYGSWYDECDSNSDCELVNGYNGDCECHTNGKSYCTPSIESDFFKEWYELCENGEANMRYYIYYYFWSAVYTDVTNFDERSDFACAKDVLADTILLASYKAAMQNGDESQYEDQEGGISQVNNGSEHVSSNFVLGSLLVLILLA